MIKTAVITAAGKGTRLQPITHAVPKVMLPLINTPVIHLVVEEAWQAGIEKIIIIVGQDGEMIQRYFNQLYTPWSHNIQYILQPEPRGLGDAIYCAKDQVAGNPFALLFGDSVFIQENPTALLVKDYNAQHQSILASQKIPLQDITKRGVLEAEHLEHQRYRLNHLHEKPDHCDFKHPLGFIARAVLNASIFAAIKQVTPDKKRGNPINPRHQPNHSN